MTRPLPEDVKKALAWFNDDGSDHYAELDARDVAFGILLATYVSAQAAQTCTVCGYYDTKHDECLHLECGGYDDAYTRSRIEHHCCDTLGRYCGAWKARTP
jgi:hypothetical protein